MNWKNTGISQTVAMAITIAGIEQIVDNDQDCGDGISPIGSAFIDSLCLISEKWYLWFNKNGSSFIREVFE